MFRRTKKSAPRRGSSSRNFRPLGESLESRLNLAGGVLAYNIAGSLYIYGDTLANNLRIEGDGLGRVEVQGVATMVNGVANGQLNATGVQNIFMDMGNGDDTATFVLTNVNGLLRFTGGNGNDSLFFGEDNNGFNAFGSVQALMGAGNDEIHVDDDDFAALTSFIASNGEGNNVTDLDPAVELFLGVVSITGGAGSDFIDIGDGLVTTGFITVNSGNGDNDFFMDGTITVNGGITVIGGSGPDNFEPGDFGNNPQFTVNGSITAALGNGENFVEFASDNVDVAGLISVTGGSGVDTFDFDTLTFDVLAISLYLGAGNNDVLLNEGATTIRSSLTITTLGGADEILGFGLDVLGATTISTGEGSDLIELDNSRHRSVVTVLTGGGSDTIRVENITNDGIGTRFDSLVSIDLGADADSIFIGLDTNDFVRFFNRVIVNGGLGTDIVTNSPFNVFAFAPTLVSFP